MPDRALPWAFDFNPEEIDAAINLGYKIASETIKNGRRFDHLENYLNELKHMDRLKPVPFSEDY